jgi:REP element-mobilizing transposase RayT
MVRPLRLEFPGALYHLTSRGNNKQNIFLNHADRRVFLDIFSRVVKDTNWLCHSYCLLKNHYHLLVETPEENLSIGMRNLNGIYSQAFNKKYDRVGHVVQGRFGSRLIQEEKHLYEVSRYIVLNPVKDGFVERPEQWIWSSYRATIGFVPEPSFLKTELFLNMFGTTRSEAREEYRRFVESSSEQLIEDPSKTAFSGLPDEAIELLEKKRSMQCFTRADRYQDRIPLESIFGSWQKNRVERNCRIRFAYDNGYNSREISEFLEMDGSTICKIIKSL